MTHAYYRYDRLSTPWRILSVSSLAAENGFRAMVFEHSDDRFLRVVVAFRGTDGLNLPDYLYGNFAWLTQWILPDNQYAAARSLMRSVVSEVTARARETGKKVCFITVGHSLGGGLAQHIAYGFPNTTAVVIDSSPVINHFRFSKPFDQARIFHLHERGDMVSWAYESLVGRYTPNNIHYPMNLVELDCLNTKGIAHRLCQVEYFVYKNHDALAVSEGMSRMIMNCRLNTKGCEIERKRPVSTPGLQLGCSARTNGSRLDLCAQYERKFGPILKGT